MSGPCAVEGFLCSIFEHVRSTFEQIVYVALSSAQARPLERAMRRCRSRPPPPSQTLSRGIRILEILADAREPLSDRRDRPAASRCTARSPTGCCEHSKIMVSRARPGGRLGAGGPDGRPRGRGGTRPAGRGASRAHGRGERARTDLLPVAPRPRRVRHPRQRRTSARRRLDGAATRYAASGHRRSTGQGDPLPAPESALAGRAHLMREARNGRRRATRVGRQATTR